MKELTQLITAAVICLVAFATFSLAHAQDATPTPTPAATLTAAPASNPVGDAVAKADSGVNWLSAWLTSSSGIVTTILGVLFALAKAVSTSKAVPVVSWIQALFDGAATLLSSLGGLFKKIADLLASVLASDGVLGKK